MPDLLFCCYSSSVCTSCYPGNIPQKREEVRHFFENKFGLFSRSFSLTAAMQFLSVERRLLHTAIRVQKGTHIFYTQQDPDRLCSEYRFLNRGVYKSRYRSAENLRQGSGAALRSRVCFAGRNLAAMLRTPALRPLLCKALTHGALTRRVQKRAIYHGGISLFLVLLRRIELRTP